MTTPQLIPVFKHGQDNQMKVCQYPANLHHFTET